MGQQQPGLLGRDRVERPGLRLRGPHGLPHRVQRPGLIPPGLPDPGQRHQAGCQRRDIGELAAQLDALGDLLQRGVEFAPLAGHLRQAHIPDARRGQRRPVGSGGSFPGLLVGLGGRVQAPPGALDLAEQVTAPGHEDGPVGPPGDAGRQGPLSRCEPAAEPLRHGQVAVGLVVQQPLALAQLGPGPRRERGGGLRIPAVLGGKSPAQRDMRGDVGQQAAGPADAGLERLIGRGSEGSFGRVSEAQHRLYLAIGRGQLGLGQQQPGTRLEQPGGKRRDPPLDRRWFPAQPVHRVEVPLDQPGRPGHLPGGDRMPDRLIGQPVLLMPGGRVPVQPRRPARLLLQAGAEQIGEQAVVTPPAAHRIERQQEQAGLLDLLQQGLAARAAGDGVAQLAAEPLQHRRLQQERLQLLGLALQYFLAQVVQDIAVTAGERGHEGGRVGLAAQGQGRELQPGRPSLGSLGQRGHSRIGQGRARPPGHLPQQRAGLARREPQVGGPQLGQLPAGPQPRQGQRRIGPAGQHQSQPRRPVFQEELHRIVHGPGADHVIVVEDQQGPVRGGPGAQVVDQRREQPLKRGRGGRPDQRAHASADSRAHPVQRGDHVPPEPGRVVIAGIQRQPRRRALAGQRPVGQQNRLAVSGRGADQDHPLAKPGFELSGQAGAGYQAGPRGRQVQLGGQQGIAPGSLRRRRRRRLSHQEHASSVPPAMLRVAAQQPPWY